MEKKRREHQFRLFPATAIGDWLFGPHEMTSHSGGREAYVLGIPSPVDSCCTSGLHMSGLRILCPRSRKRELRGTWHGCEVRCCRVVPS